MAAHWLGYHFRHLNGYKSPKNTFITSRSSLKSLRSTVIVIDTNFLLACIDFQIDIISGFERILPGFSRLLVPHEVIRELQRLQTTRIALVARINLAHQFIERHCEVIEPLSSEKRPNMGVDDTILAIAKEFGGLIATNDRELRKKSRAAGIASIFLRERAYIEVDRI